MVMSCLLYLV